MKKLFYYFCAQIYACCTLMSCTNFSSSPYYSEETIEKRLLEMKQQFREFGMKYGIENISFNESQMRNHLNVTTDDIEKEVISMAIAMGKADKNSGVIRRSIRKHAILRNEDEPNHVFVCISGDYESEYQQDSLLLEYKLRLFSGEIGGFYIIPGSAKATKMYKCNLPNCNLWHKSNVTEVANLWHISHEAPSVSYGSGVGTNGHISCYCSFVISKSSHEFDFSINISKHVELDGIVEREL